MEDENENPKEPSAPLYPILEQMDKTKHKDRIRYMKRNNVMNKR